MDQFVDRGEVKGKGNGGMEDDLQVFGFSSYVDKDIFVVIGMIQSIGLWREIQIFV